MSSRDCYTLEGFIDDCIFGGSCKLHIMLITKLLVWDPNSEFVNCRESIEDNINCDFDEETQSWRTYRNTLCSNYFDPYNKEICQILEEQSKVVLSILLLCDHYTSYQQTLLKTVLQSVPNAETDIARFIDQFKDTDTTIDEFLPKYLSWFKPHFLQKLSEL